MTDTNTNIPDSRDLNEPNANAPLRASALFPECVLAEHVQPRVYAYYFRQWTQFDMPFHVHDSTEIMYLISGQGRVDVKGKGPAELTKGEFIMLDGNVPHRLFVAGTCRMLNVEFGYVPRRAPFLSVRDLAEEEGALVRLLTAPSPSVVLRDPDEVYHALKALVFELDGRGKSRSGGEEADIKSKGPDNAGVEAMSQLLLAQLLIRIARLLDAASASAALPLADQYITKCVEFLHQNYDRDIQVKDVAAAVNLHPGYVHRLFGAHVGRTLTAYLTSLRIEKAKMLLRQTDIPISDISDYVGIGSRQYFHALFKKHVEQTPVQYRRSMMALKRDSRPRK